MLNQIPFSSAQSFSRIEKVKTLKIIFSRKEGQNSYLLEKIIFKNPVESNPSHFLEGIHRHTWHT
jgi:hypothetical protein